MPSLILRPGRERSVVNRHPWVFSGAVARLVGHPAEGDILEVKDTSGKTLGLGFYSGKSQITCRVFEFDGFDIDPLSAPYWQQKLDKALALRQATVISPETDSYRLIHAEGDGMPGLVADVFGGVLVAQIGTRGAELLWPLWSRLLEQMGYHRQYLRVKENPGKEAEVSLKSGFVREPFDLNVQALEHGMRFKVDIAHGQKTGFFLDQRDARRLVRKLARDRNLLNAFGYTGGFSVAALLGGAASVTSVDISKEAVAVAEENMRLNGAPEGFHKAVAADCFDYLKSMDPGFDLVVLDPPAFAKNARSVANAARGYKELNLQAMRHIAPGGLLFTFSCSQHIGRDLFRKIVFSAAADARRPVRLLYQTTQPPDHPIDLYHPEGEYLKGLVLLVG